MVAGVGAFMPPNHAGLRFRTELGESAQDMSTPRRSDGLRSLVESLQEEDEAGVMRYIDAGYDCDVADALGDPAVNLAAAWGNLRVVEALNTAGARITLKGFHGGETALMLSARFGSTEIVEYLLKHREVLEDIDETSNAGDTALNIASYWGQVPVVKLLLTAGADTELINNQDMAPGEEFDFHVQASGASDEVKNILNEYRRSRGLLKEEKKENLLWYLED